MSCLLMPLIAVYQLELATYRLELAVILINQLII